MTNETTYCTVETEAIFFPTKQQIRQSIKQHQQRGLISPQKTHQSSDLAGKKEHATDDISTRRHIHTFEIVTSVEQSPSAKMQPSASGSFLGKTIITLSFWEKMVNNCITVAANLLSKIRQIDTLTCRQ